MIPTYLQLARPSDLSVPAGAATAITWTILKTSLNWPTLTLPLSTIPVPSAGLYRITTSIWWDTNATGLRYLYLTANGDQAQPWDYETPINVQSGAPQALTACYWLPSTDLLQALVQHTLGTTRTLIGATRSEERRVGKECRL